MLSYADTLSQAGFRLRSGHADGADWAFEQGAAGNADIFLPWPGFGKERLVLGTRHDSPEEWTKKIASEVHPGWARLNRPARLLHMRNIHQICGLARQERSSFVLCWTPAGRGAGGTGQAIRLAKKFGIPVYDLGRMNDLEVADVFSEWTKP